MYNHSLAKTAIRNKIIIFVTPYWEMITSSIVKNRFKTRNLCNRSNPVF